ncbi:MAG: hypothetical protein ACE5LU_08760 [Anaerolineae bacterium]
MMSQRTVHLNGHQREEAEALQRKLDAIMRSIRAGKDRWRNLQRKRYLEMRLRKLVETN